MVRKQTNIVNIKEKLKINKKLKEKVLKDLKDEEKQ